MAARGRILVVEDDIDTSELLVLVLEGAGYEVRTAVDGIEALTALGAEAERPDVLLLDLWLPRLGGGGLLRRLRRDPGLAKLPVLILTGAPIPPEVAALADGAMEKPFDVEELVAAVRRLVRSRKPGPPTPAPSAACA